MAGTDDWYERRLVEETGKLRLEASAIEVRLIDRIAQSEATLRQETGGLRRGVDEFRTEVRNAFLDVRKELGTLRVEVATSQASTIKWMFAFWVGQFAAMAGLFAAFR